MYQQEKQRYNSYEIYMMVMQKRKGNGRNDNGNQQKVEEIDHKQLILKELKGKFYQTESIIDHNGKERLI